MATHAGYAGYATAAHAGHAGYAGCAAAAAEGRAADDSLERQAKWAKGHGGLKGAGGGGKGKSTGSPEEAGEVRFDAVESAQRAYQLLDKSVLMGVPITVVPDTHSQDGTKVLVYNMPPGIEWQELKDHFSQVGTVCFASIGRRGAGGKGADAGGSTAFAHHAPPPSVKGGPPCVGEVRFSSPDEASQAMRTFNGGSFGGNVINIERDRSSQDGSKVLIYNLPGGTMWQDLKDFFSACGRVSFAGISGQKGAGKRGAAHFGADGGGGVVGANGVPLPPITIGEVRFENPQDADKAAQVLGGTLLNGGQISIHKDATAKDGSRLIVSNVPPGTPWQDLKDHFTAIGPVAYAGVNNGFGGKGKAKGKDKGGGFDGGCCLEGPPPVGEVRFNDPQCAQIALRSLDQSVLRGSPVSVRQDEHSLDGSKLLISNLPPGCMWQELKDHFQTIGTVAFAVVHKGFSAMGGKGYGKVPPPPPMMGGVMYDMGVAY